MNQSTSAPVLIHDGFPPDLFDFSSPFGGGTVGGSSASRTSGVHISGITHAMAIHFGYLKERPMSELIRQAFMGLGTAIEWALAYAYSRRHPGEYIHQPGEMIKDGILAHIDLIRTPDPRGLIVDDVKMRWCSSHKPLTDPSFWEAWTRLKGYCHYVGSHIGRLHVVYPNGEGFGKRPDGSPKQFGPVYRIWEWEWTELEIEQNWAMLLNHKHMAEAEK